MSSKYNYEKRLKRWEKFDNNKSAIFLISILIFGAIFFLIFNHPSISKKNLEEGSQEFKELKSTAEELFTSHIQGATYEVKLGSSKFVVNDENVKAINNDYIGNITIYYNSNGELDYKYTNGSDNSQTKLLIYIIFPLIFGTILGCGFVLLGVMPFTEWRIKRIKEAIKQSNT